MNSIIVVNGFRFGCCRLIFCWELPCQLLISIGAIPTISCSLGTERFIAFIIVSHSKVFAFNHSFLLYLQSRQNIVTSSLIKEL